MKRYIMALDAGTTGNRCILFDHTGTPVASAHKEFRQIYPQPGWVEHDAEEIWSTQLEVCRLALEKAGATYEDIAAIGITNQRETVIVWDKTTGKPVYNAIVWQCRRTAEACDALKAQGAEPLFRERTGLVLDAYSSGTKIGWILDHVPGAREHAERGELLFGTVDTWLIYNLTGGRVHVTDVTNASRTLAFNIHTLSWDKELLELLRIPESMLPEVRPSSCVYGETDPALFGGPIPIAGCAGDQQAALFGQACFAPGDAKNTYGTGCFMLMNIGEKPVLSKNGLITTIAWGLDGKVEYALEGSVFIAGAAIQWLRDELKLIETSPESEALASAVPDSNGCYVVPAFTGLGAPYWDPYARGCIVGLTRGVNRNHLVRATLESLCYLTNDVMQAMREDSGISELTLRADGGASANDLLMQIQSDIIDAAVIRPKCVETTALGASYLAGLAVGFWASKEEVAANWAADRTFIPAITEEERTRRLKGWHKAVRLAFDWARD